MAVAPEVEVLLRRTYDAFNRKDVSTVLAVAHADVDWANALDGTRVIGVEHVQEYWERQFRVVDPQVEVLSITEDAGGDVVVDLRQTVRFLSDGEVVLDEIVQHIFSFRDGLIAAMDVRDARGNLVAPRRGTWSDA
jgi:ketosteroid isomerase-like protein